MIEKDFFTEVNLSKKKTYIFRFSAANLQKKEGKSKKAGQTFKKLQSLYEMSLPMSLAFYASGKIILNRIKLIILY